MKSYKSFTGVKGGLAVLPTLEERELSSSSDGSSVSLDYHQDQEGTAASYPVDLLGVSWGSYLNSQPPTRGGNHEAGQGGSTGDAALLQNSAVLEGVSKVAPELVRTSPTGREGANEPHPLLQHLEGLMTALIRSRQELTKCGLDVTPLIPLCNASIASHKDLKMLVMALSKDCKEVVLNSDLVHNLVEYLREVLQGLIGQGRKLNVQAAFLQQSARQLSRKQQESLKEQHEMREAINKSRSRLDVEKEELERQRHSIYEAKVELKKMLLEAEENWSHQGRKKKGRMDSPHSVAQGRSQLVALLKTQNQQSRLEKALTQQERDIRHLQQAHDLAKSELLAVQDHAMKLQRKLARQITEVRNSESALTAQLHISQDASSFPSMALDKEKRKSYHNTSRAQVKATLKGIAAAQKNLSTEIERMQRQFSEQHMTERRLSRQLEDSCRSLLETESRLKAHTATIKGGRKHSKTELQQMEEEKPFKLPKISQAEKNAHRCGSVMLPEVHQSNHTTASEMTGKSRTKRLPSYQFSKTELFTLAKFDDHETAEQVMTWLQSQGRLQK